MLLDKRFDECFRYDWQDTFVRRLAEAKTVRFEREPIFTFKSGIPSRLYFSGREDFTDNVPLMRDVGILIAHMVKRYEGRHFPAHKPRRICLIGVPVAGNALAAVASQGHWGGFPFRVMRESKKSYGIHSSWVTGKPVFAQHLYWTADNVLTDGKSKLEMIKRLSVDGYIHPEMTHLVLADYGFGAVEWLKSLGHKVEAVLKLSSLYESFGRLGLWCASDVEGAQEELLRLKKLVRFG